MARMADTPKEAVVCHLPLDKTSGLSWKTLMKVFIQHSCINVRSVDVLSGRVKHSYLCHWLIIWKWVTAFESLQAYEKMVRAWVQNHTVFKRSHKSTMIHWQTWDFQHSDQSTIVFPHSSVLLSFALLLLTVSQKPWKGGAPHLYWSMCVCIIYDPSASLKYQTRSISFYSPNHKPFVAIHLLYMRGTARHGTAHSLWNSLLTPLFQMVSLTLADQSHFGEWLHRKDIREGFQVVVFCKAGNSICPEKST